MFERMSQRNVVNCPIRCFRVFSLFKLIFEEYAGLLQIKNERCCTLDPSLWTSNRRALFLPRLNDQSPARATSIQAVLANPTEVIPLCGSVSLFVGYSTKVQDSC